MFSLNFSALNSKQYFAIGLSSGTSADGIDAALVKFAEKPLAVKLEAFHVSPYSPALRKRILNASSRNATLIELGELDMFLGRMFAEAALNLLKKERFPIGRVHFIGSHGQTLYHQPPSQTFLKRIPFTLQIGDGCVISQETGVLTVSDFRSADLAAGGEGAPLVPYVDWRLFSHPRKGRVLLNLGGIGNFTYLPPNCKLNQIVACDTGPGNALLDALIRSWTNGKESFDRDGKLAGKGNVERQLLRSLLRHPFLKLPLPKSAERSLFGEALAKKLQKKDLPFADLMATATAFTAESVAIHLVKYAGEADEIYMSGGGAKNGTLLKMLKESVERKMKKKIAFHLFDSLGIPAKAKEAVAFAFLAYETLKGRTSNVPKVTGAKRDCVLGKISPGWMRQWKLL